MNELSQMSLQIHLTDIIKMEIIVKEAGRKVSVSKQGEKGVSKNVGTEAGRSEYVSGLELSPENNTKLLLELQLSPLTLWK